MNQLEAAYLDLDLHTENLIHWYSDFETIHLYQDGNGRTGGIIVAAFSYLQLGIYLAPEQ